MTSTLTGCASWPATCAIPSASCASWVSHPREAFLAEPRSVNSAKYLLIVATEAALDICNHLAARRGGPRSWRLPTGSAP